MTAKSAVLAQLVQVVASEGSDKPLPVRSALDERASRRWPSFSAAARTEIGPATISAIPIQPGIDVLGRKPRCTRRPEWSSPSSGWGPRMPWPC